MTTNNTSQNQSGTADNLTGLCDLGTGHERDDLGVPVDEMSTERPDNDPGTLSIERGSTVIPLIIDTGTLTEDLSRDVEGYYSSMGSSNPNLDNIELQNDNTFTTGNSSDSNGSGFNDTTITDLTI